ncbi:MAG: DUF3987 domain-containing protein, partial [Vicinamibacteria bacterium]
EDKRLMIVEGELASVLQVMSRKGNTLSSQLRNAWDHGNMGTMVRHDPLRATGAHISLVGQITREELTRHLTTTEMASGLGNRFAWFLGFRVRELPEGGALRKNDLEPTVTKLIRAVSKARGIGLVERSPDAKAAWSEIYSTLTKDVPGMVGHMRARSAAQVLRFSVLYAVLDGSAVIETQHLAAALAVWDYAEASVARIFAGRTGDPLADRILEIVRAAPEKRISRTDLQNKLGRNYEAQRLDDAISILESMGLLRSYTTETPGRPATIYVAL